MQNQIKMYVLKNTFVWTVKFCEYASVDTALFSFAEYTVPRHVFPTTNSTSTTYHTVYISERDLSTHQSEDIEGFQRFHT